MISGRSRRVGVSTPYDSPLTGVCVGVSLRLQTEPQRLTWLRAVPAYAVRWAVVPVPTWSFPLSKETLCWVWGRGAVCLIAVCVCVSVVHCSAGRLYYGYWPKLRLDAAATFCGSSAKAAVTCTLCAADCCDIWWLLLPLAAACRGCTPVPLWSHIFAWVMVLVLFYFEFFFFVVWFLINGVLSDLKMFCLGAF